MKVLIDANVVLDLWLLREPHWRDSAKLLALAETRQIEAWIYLATITTLHDLSRDVLGEETTRGLLESLLSIAQVGVLDSAVFTSALASEQVSCNVVSNDRFAPSLSKIQLR